MRIHKGDQVQVLTGKNRGKTGEVIRVIPKKGTVIVAGVKIAKRSQKAARATMQAGIIDKDMPMPASAVALICSKDGPTRAAYQVEPDGTKVRVCAKCGARL